MSTEAYLLRELTNNESEPQKVKDMYVTFRRPAYKEKHRHEAWYGRQQKELQFEPDSGLSTLYSFWTTLNSWITNIYVLSEEGEKVIKGEKFDLYEKTDDAYISAFEQLVESKHNEGGEEGDELIMSAFEAFRVYMDEFGKHEADDLKNS